MSDNDELLTAAEVAERIGKTEFNVNRMANESLITGVKVGGEWKFKAADVEKYLDFVKRFGG